jgi:hypothetical protein
LRVRGGGAVMPGHEHQIARDNPGAAGSWAPTYAPRAPGRKPGSSPARPIAPRPKPVDPHGRLWRPCSAFPNDRSMHQRRPELARGGVQSLQDAREPAAGWHPPATRHPDLETGSLAEMSLLPQWPLGATGANDQADRGARDDALQMGASGRGALDYEARTWCGPINKVGGQRWENVKVAPKCKIVQSRVKPAQSHPIAHKLTKTAPPHASEMAKPTKNGCTACSRGAGAPDRA